MKRHAGQATVRSGEHLAADIQERQDFTLRDIRPVWKSVDDARFSQDDQPIRSWHRQHVYRLIDADVGKRNLCGPRR